MLPQCNKVLNLVKLHAESQNKSEVLIQLALHKISSKQSLQIHKYITNIGNF